MRRTNLADGWHEIAPPSKIVKMYGEARWFICVVNRTVVCLEPVGPGWRTGEEKLLTIISNSLMKKDGLVTTEEQEESFMNVKGSDWQQPYDTFVITPHKHDWEDSLELE